jgi:hypothetical protein
MAFIILDPVFEEKGAVFILKSPRAVVFNLSVDVRKQGIPVGWSERKRAVASIMGAGSGSGAWS